MTWPQVPPLKVGRGILSSTSEGHWDLTWRSLFGHVGHELLKQLSNRALWDSWIRERVGGVDLARHTVAQLLTLEVHAGLNVLHGLLVTLILWWHHIIFCRNLNQSGAHDLVFAFLLL